MYSHVLKMNLCRLSIIPIFEDFFRLILLQSLGTYRINIINQYINRFQHCPYVSRAGHY